jgi:hypothetical protein
MVAGGAVRMINDNYQVTVNQVSVSIVQGGRFFVKGFTRPLVVEIENSFNVSRRPPFGFFKVCPRVALVSSPVIRYRPDFR